MNNNEINNNMTEVKANESLYMNKKVSSDIDSHKQKIKFPTMKLISTLIILLLLFFCSYLYYQNTNLGKTHSELTTQIVQPTIQPSPDYKVGAAQIQHIWDKNFEKSSANIYLFVLLRGWGSNKIVTLEVAIQNRSQMGMDISPNDFSFLDENGNKLGEVVVNGGKSPFIPNGGYIDPQWQMVGYITFTNVTDIFNLKSAILRFQPQVESANPIDYSISFELPVAG